MDETRQRRTPRTLLGLLWVAAALCAWPVHASDYVGLWRLDVEGEGIVVSYPDEGFAGACVELSGGEGPGSVRIESQIVRHRFDSVNLVVNGNIDPLAVHVQLSVKGKIAWLADETTFEGRLVTVPLNGYELVIEAATVVDEVAPWSLRLCSMTFVNDRFDLRFTSDCAGLDFVEKEDEVRLVVDEDWFALEREMQGGLGLFGLERAWGGTEGEGPVVTVTTSFPAQLFYTAFSQVEKPLIEPLPGTPDEYLASGEGYGLVVKTKGGVVGQMDWLTTLSWGTPDPVVTDVVEAPEFVEVEAADLATPPDVAGDLVADMQADSEKSGSSGCTAGATASPAAALLLLLLFAAICGTRHPVLPGRSLSTVRNERAVRK